MRRCKYRMFAILFAFLSMASANVKAEIDNACWTSPTLKIVADLELSSLSGNKAGATGAVAYSMPSPTFSALCNRFYDTAKYNYMTHYVDLGPGLQSSTVNSGWYRLNDDIDIKISTMAFGKEIFLPAKPEDGLIGSVKPPVGCVACLVSDFYIAAYGTVHIKLRRDVIGGALVFPRNEKLFSAYRVGNYIPFPVKPGMPIMELYTSSAGSIIPIPAVCEINGGNAINVDFGMLLADKIGTYVEQELDPKSINLAVSCNTNLTQGAKIRLVSDHASFSGKLIRSSNEKLGVAMRHNGNVIAPFETFPLWLKNGQANEQITLSLVRNASGSLQEGKFTASATLIIESL